MSPRILQRVAREPGVLAESDKWRTPPPLHLALDSEFDFVLDLAADETNRLYVNYLGSGSWLAEDALTVNWRAQAERVESQDWPSRTRQSPCLWGFLNPPYSSQLIKQFVEYTVEQTRLDFGVVVLLPDTHDTQWYRHLRWASEIRRIPHRVPYLKADGSTKAGAMFPSCVAIFRPQPGVRNPSPRVVEWTWRQE